MRAAMTLEGIVSMTVKKTAPMVGVALALLAVNGCSEKPSDSKDYKALSRSRSDVIAGARVIRNESRAQAQPSANFFGNFYRCSEKSRIHYSLETDWITPKDDAEDLRTFEYVIRTLQSNGWVASSATSRRERTMRHGDLEIRITINPGAAWITGILGGPCYNPKKAVEHFLGRPADQLSG